jgi:hypothetical protein
LAGFGLDIEMEAEEFVQFEGDIESEMRSEVRDHD